MRPNSVCHALLAAGLRSASIRSSGSLRVCRRKRRVESRWWRSASTSGAFASCSASGSSRSSHSSSKNRSAFAASTIDRSMRPFRSWFSVSVTSTDSRSDA